MCCGENKNKDIISKEFWDVLLRIPSFRYLKEPVNNVSELYERYPDGAERGAMSYVYGENRLYRWNFMQKIWESLTVGLLLEDVLELLNSHISNADWEEKRENEKSFILNKPDILDLVGLNTPVNDYKNIVSVAVAKQLYNMIQQSKADTHFKGIVHNAFNSQEQTWGISKTTIPIVVLGGSGYRKYESLIINSDKFDDIFGSLIVTDVDENGGIISVELGQQGDYSNSPIPSPFGATTVTGDVSDFLGTESGTGASITLRFDKENASTLFDIADPTIPSTEENNWNPNDEALVLIDETRGGITYYWAIVDYNKDGKYNWMPNRPSNIPQRDFTVNPIGENGINEVANGAIKKQHLDVDGIPVRNIIGGILSAINWKNVRTATINEYVNLRNNNQLEANTIYLCSES
jgi:hypothetical protein